MNRAATHAYIGIKTCGCVVAAAVDYRDKATADSVREMILNGYELQRVTINECRARIKSCQCGKQLALQEG